eukprot:m.287044 g.287044  ORF g.287044 m.287044 type:complete len:72 (-) comp19942_c0_seq4:704-919(-)
MVDSCMESDLWNSESEHFSDGVYTLVNHMYSIGVHVSTVTETMKFTNSGFPCSVVRFLHNIALMCITRRDT